MVDPLGERISVRPTKRTLDDLGLSWPDLTESLSDIDHPLIRRAQRIPEEAVASGVERVKALNDRVWFKCKTSVYRAAVTNLTASESESCGLPAETSWWIGAAGIRRADSKEVDFYSQLEAEAIRHGKGTGTVSTVHLLPQQADCDRYTAEAHARGIEALKLAVRKIIAKSLNDGKPYMAELPGYRVTAVARAADEEAYLAIIAEGFPDPRIIGIILDAVPDIPKDDWQPEPGHVADIVPGHGQIIWSAIIPPSAQSKILSYMDALEQN
jgi:hypothetical protein